MSGSISTNCYDRNASKFQFSNAINSVELISIDMQQKILKKPVILPNRNHTGILSASRNVSNRWDSFDQFKIPSSAVYSSIYDTTDEIDDEFDAVVIDKSDHIEPVVHIDDCIQFIEKLARMMHLVGETIHRIEYNITIVSEKLGLECEILSYPTTLLLCFGDYTGNVNLSKESFHSLYTRKVHLYVGDQSLDGNKLFQLDSLSNLLAESKITFRQAYCELNRIEELPLLFSMQVQIISTAVSSCTVAGVFFGGTWQDVVFCFILGIFVGWFCYVSDRDPTLARLQLVLSGFFSAFCALFIQHYWLHGLCLSSDVLSALCWILPGFSFTLALVELSNNNITSGTSRLFWSLMMCLQLGGGATLGFQTANLIITGKFTDLGTVGQQCDILLPSYTEWILFFPMVLSWNILLNSSTKQWLIMLTASAVAQVVYNYTYKIVGGNVSNTLSALSIGLISNTYCRFRNEPSTVIVLSAIFLLVPGGIGVRSVSAFLTNDSNLATEYAFGMISCGLSLTVGISLANLIVYPSKKLRYLAY